MRVLLVGLGGFLGAVARYGLSGLVHRWFGAAFPWGTLAVNALGCLFLGALMRLVEDGAGVPPEARSFLALGLLGSFTTFSTFGHETVELLAEGSGRAAAANVLLNLALGLGAVIVGRLLGRALS